MNSQPPFAAVARRGHRAGWVGREGGTPLATNVSRSGMA